ncbi:ABC transporter permease [Streptomyces sp. NRRL WC-3742]|uniref:ABC transporter permease n=1 Tax=Streptomyces sp. NRRL WC-3742 TaxID=1463934 RepID=UPI0004C869EF|nr:ABC transporter permease [Streptomyces sp. NRRL WC-3742]
MRPTAAALRAERIKFTTLPSQWAAPPVALVLTVGITAAVNAAYGHADQSLLRDQGLALYYGLLFGHVAVACLGVLLIGQEFNTGMIATSLTAVPRRTRLYGAKLALGATLGLLLGLATATGCFLAVAGTTGLDLSTPGLTRAFLAGALYHPLLVLLCLGLTTMLGNFSAALGLIAPMVFLGTTWLAAIPGVREIGQFLPDRAGLYATHLQTDPDIHYGHWTGLLIMALWTAAAVYGGLRAIRRREVA